MNCTDRRQKKTERVLRESLAELLAEKPLQTITVKELSEKADVHRSTFYAHYTDVYQLYRQIEEELLGEIQKIIDKDYARDLTACYSLLIRYAYANKKICRLLFTENSYTALQALTKTFEDSCNQYWCRILGCEELAPRLKYCVQYHVGGCIALLRHWCLSGFEMSVADMTALITDIDKAMASYIEACC